jgi:hypothetical protein
MNVRFSFSIVFSNLNLASPPFKRFVASVAISSKRQQRLAIVGAAADPGPAFGNNAFHLALELPEMTRTNAVGEGAQDVVG